MAHFTLLAQLGFALPLSSAPLTSLSLTARPIPSLLGGPNCQLHPPTELRSMSQVNAEPPTRSAALARTLPHTYDPPLSPLVHLIHPAEISEPTSIKNVVEKEIETEEKGDRAATVVLLEHRRLSIEKYSTSFARSPGRSSGPHEAQLVSRTLGIARRSRFWPRIPLR